MSANRHVAGDVGHYFAYHAGCQSLARHPGVRQAITFAAVGFSGSDPFRHFSVRLPAALQHAAAKRRNEFLAGRYCASRALAKAGYAHDIWPEGDETGLPLWPPGWIGSISHTADRAMAAVTRRPGCSGLHACHHTCHHACHHACQRFCQRFCQHSGLILGVDVERLIAPAQCAEIQTQVARPDELSLLAELAPVQAMTLLFSAKEALFKALYPQVRRFVDFFAAQATHWDGRTLSLRLTRSWSADWPQGTQVDVACAFADAHVYTAACGRQLPAGGSSVLRVR